MIFRSALASRYLYVCLGFILICGSARAQTSLPSRPINLDRDLKERTDTDRAASYYHYSLAKWHENNGDTRKALSEMQLALQSNPASAPLHVEIAILMGRTGNINEAIRYAQEAVRIDPKDPDPHWLLANIYFGSQERKGPSKDNLLKAIQELETLKELAPEDERIYYNLGGAYFELNEAEKAIQAFEKYQALSNSDGGYREIARYYERTGNLEKAIEFLKKGLEIQPDSAESLMLLANIYSKTNNKEAVPIYKKLLSLSSDSAPVMRRLGAALFDAGEYQEAIRVFEELETKARPDRTSQILQGRAYLALRRHPEAIKFFKSVLERIPDDMETRFFLGNAYEESGNYEEAATLYAALLKEASGASQEAVANRPLFQQRLAAVYLELGEYDKSIALYEEMPKTDPRVNLQLLNAYRVSGRFDKGLPLGETLFKSSPQDAHLGIIYARTLADAGKPKDGAEILATLLQSNPDNVDLYINLSEIYRQDRRYSDAEKILLRGEDRNIHPEANERLKFQRASVYERQKDFDRAELLFKEILKANPENPTVLNYLGYMLADRGVRLEEAVRYVQDALALDPHNGAYLDSLGWAFYKMNDLEKAEKYLLEAEALIRNDATIIDHLGDLYFKTGNFEKARDFWMRSMRMGKEPDEVQKVRRKLESLQETLRKQKNKK